MGVHLVNPDQPVVGITGDGGLNMTIGELETARRAGAPITSIVVNNAASGYVKSLQHAIFDGRYQSSDLIELDYARIANAFGCQGIRVEDPSEFSPAITTGLSNASQPTVIDVAVIRDPAKMPPRVGGRTLQSRKGRPIRVSF